MRQNKRTAFHQLFRLAIASFVFWLLSCLTLSAVVAITADECERKMDQGDQGSLSLDDLHACEEYFLDFFNQANSQKRSLESEIKKFNAAISITVTKIFSTQEEIENLEEEIQGLSGKIYELDLSLDELSALLIERITATYKKGKIQPLALFLSSEGFSEFVSRYKYLKIIQAHDRDLLFQLETARSNYEGQKTLKEEKQTELEEAKKNLESQKTILAQQKIDKENLLAVTKNSETKYQELLATTRAEIEAIQAIIAGKGEESQVGGVSQGETIAWVISGASACSTGTHLHFEVREGDQVKNPLSYLQNISLINQSGGDPAVGSGDWSWPLNQPIYFNQGYGAGTSAIRSGVVWYDFHTGIDIVSPSLGIQAVKPGTLYRGSIGCGGGTLRYVRVDHNDSGIDTYYLHVNY